MKKKKSFIKSIRLFSLLTVLCISMTILCFELFLHVSDYRERSRELTESFYTEKQYVLESEINRIITRHSFQSNQIQINIEKEVKTHCRMAYQIMDAFYGRNKENLSQREMRKEVTEILRSITYRGQYGYFYALEPDGTTILNRANPDIEGKSTINAQDGEGRYFIRDMIDLALSEGEGYYSYLWFREGGEQAKDLVKTGYVMFYEPLNLIIGTSVFEEDLKGDLQKNLITSIEYVFADSPEYIFIIRGDGVVLIGPNKGANVLSPPLTKQDDSSQSEIFLKMRETAEGGGGFMTYPCPKKENVSYLSYVTLVKEWGWLIGARITTEELDEGIGVLEEKLKRILRDEFLRIVALTGILGIFVYFIINRLNRSLLKDLSLYSRFFQDAALNDVLIDRDKLHYREFFELSEFANKMISEKITAEEERRKLRNLESLGYLAAGIAHDFNNCLMGIYGYIELAQMSLDNPEESKTYLAHSLETMERVRNISDRLLTFAKSGKPLHDRISLNSLLKKELETFRKSGSIRLDYRAGDEIFYTQGEKRQTSLILEMILTNSREALPQGKGIITVTIKREILHNAFPCHLEGPYIRIDIIDNGTGIKQENLNKIFDPYYTTKQIGRGLGLSTVFSIIHQHRGHVEASRAPGGGTVMSLYFPEAAAPTAAD